MTKYIFIVLGYGIPKNIIKDKKYNLYIRKVFDYIQKKTINTQSIDIIFCGGKTDLTEPYIRNEADEMIKLFSFLKNKEISFWKNKKINLIVEKESLSTLENLLKAQKIIKKHNSEKYPIIIFCEKTRRKRVKIISEKIFAKYPKIIAIDFDKSFNQNLSKKYLLKKEKLELEHSLWAMESSKNLKKHHKIFEEKFEYLRKNKNKKEMKVLKDWWDKKIEEIRKNSF